MKKILTSLLFGLIIGAVSTFLILRNQKEIVLSDSITSEVVTLRNETESALTKFKVLKDSQEIFSAEVFSNGFFITVIKEGKNKNSIVFSELESEGIKYYDVKTSESKEDGRIADFEYDLNIGTVKKRFFIMNPEPMIVDEFGNIVKQLTDQETEEK